MFPVVIVKYNLVILVRIHFMLTLANLASKLRCTIHTDYTPDFEDFRKDHETSH